MRNKKLVLKTSELPSIAMAFVVTFYFVINGFTINGFLQMCAFMIIAMLAVFSYKSSHFNASLVVWLLSLLPFLWCINEWTVANIRDFVAYFAFVVFVLFGTKKINSYDKAINIIFLMAFFHLLFLIINILFRDSFNNFLYSTFASRAMPNLNKVIRGNYYTGLGYIPGDTSGYFVDGLIILFCTKSKKQGHMFALKMVLLGIGVMFCAKKSHILCLVLSLLLVWLLNAKGGKRVSRIVLAIVTIMGVVIIGYAILPALSSIPMVNRFSVALDSFLAGKDYTSNRTTLTSYALQMFSQNHIWGIGWKYFNSFTYNMWGWSNYVNNIYIQLLAETGIVGLALFAIPMLITLVRTIKAFGISRNLENQQINQKLMLSLGVQFFFLLYGIFEIPFYDYTFLFVYAISVCLANSAIYEINTYSEEK